MKGEWRLRLLIGTGVAAVVLAGAALLPLNAVGGRVSTWLGAPSTMQQAGPLLRGTVHPSRTPSSLWMGAVGHAHRRFVEP